MLSAIQFSLNLQQFCCKTHLIFAALFNFLMKIEIFSISYCLWHGSGTSFLRKKLFSCKLIPIASEQLGINELNSVAGTELHNSTKSPYWLLLLECNCLFFSLLLCLTIQSIVASSPFSYGTKETFTTELLLFVF